MAFIKGQSGNPVGRKKGTKNKSTQEIRSLIQEIIASNFNKTKISRDLNDLKPHQKLQFLLKLLDFVVPKPVAQQLQENTSRSTFHADIIEKLKISGAIDPDSQR